MSFTINSEIAVCGGKLLKLSSLSKVCKTNMDVNVYVPKQYYAGSSNTIPTLYFLSGLTCTPQNASEKALWQVQADKYGFAVVYPDTSPRGDDVAKDPEGSWDFAIGAGFYVNATQAPFSTHYQMYDYVHKELPASLESFFKEKFNKTKIDFVKNISISGHSMGGLGALAGFLKNYGNNVYKSCSAFAPIADPTTVPWGQKAFTGYLGPDKKAWEEYDPCLLVKQVENTRGSEILIHVGTNDPFLYQLKPESLTAAAKGTSWDGKISVNMVEGFDHSYYFVSTFVPEHAKFHAKHLGLT
ncbi:HBR399Wp [Eremothecium sinecaudum]|uniref:S-formylglutathione hydrolase n=1 Tax=Eremothecium sinecaudum TaxID=45286 RepID=A0A109UVG4_9SACH|nr:HBR399Wp [Eremothecium sinecaudum]AMD19300.1 HBR399Wp [Eremothecium sinecaudum]